MVLSKTFHQAKPREDDASRNAELRMEQASLDGAEKIKQLSIAERTKRAMLAEVKNLPLMEGRRCEGGTCCAECSRNIFPTFASEQETDFSTFPELGSCNDIAICMTH